MWKRILWSGLTIAVLMIIYLVAWPVPIAPKAWQAPPNPGHTGPFAANTRLSSVELVPLKDLHGPEAVAIDTQGWIYTGTHGGWIVRLNPDGAAPTKWVNTQGRPLGMAFDEHGDLIVADAMRGLLSIAPDGSLTELATSADGIPIRYADDVDVARDGKIYFSDASVKFGARQIGDTYKASHLDILEHGGHGRLLVYDPRAGLAKTLLSGLNFANGVAVSPDQTYVLVNETGRYRILRYWLAGPRKGTADTFIDALPGFPDNISTGHADRFWVAFISPRNALLDRLAGHPFWRSVIQRLPEAIKPKAVAYGHIIAIDGQGHVVADLQDPQGRQPFNTSVAETADYLYIGSLFAPSLGRLPKTGLGL